MDKIKGGYAIVELPITIVESVEGATVAGIYNELLTAVKSAKPVYVYGLTIDGLAHSSTYVDIAIDTNKLYVEVGGYKLTVNANDNITWEKSGGGSTDSSIYLLNGHQLYLGFETFEPLEVEGIFDEVDAAVKANKPICLYNFTTSGAMADDASPTPIVIEGYFVKEIYSSHSLDVAIDAYYFTYYDVTGTQQVFLVTEDDYFDYQIV